MDSQMLSPGDTGYDPTTDPDSGQYGQPPAAPPTPPAGNGLPSTPWLPSQQGSGAAPAETFGPDFGPNANWSKPEVLNAYFQSRGVSPNASSVPYWQQQWAQWGSKDPNYFYQRLQAADEFGGGGASKGGFNIDPSYLAPFTEKFQVPGDPNNPASAAFAANPKAFELPTEADLFSSPGFQGAQTAARNAVVNSNASKGLINSGGSIYDLANVASGLEGQQYNDLVNQRANAYGINLGAGQGAFNNAWQQYLGRQNTFYSNQSNPFNKLQSLANLGLNAASQ